MLAARLASEGELSKAVTQHLMDLSWLEMPECQHPLLQQVLVSELGDLEACWRDSDLKDNLLSLPLLGMKLSSTSVQSQLVRLRVGLQLLKLFFSSGPAVMFKFEFFFKCSCNCVLQGMTDKDPLPVTVRLLAVPDNFTSTCHVMWSSPVRSTVAL